MCFDIVICQCLIRSKMMGLCSDYLKYMKLRQFIIAVIIVKKITIYYFDYERSIHLCYIYYIYNIWIILYIYKTVHE